MELFRRNKITILKEATSFDRQIEELKELSKQAKGSLKADIENQIYLLEKGNDGENEIMFQLKYCDLDLIILRDITLVSNDLKAQIDYYIITPKMDFLIECKNLVGDISINAKGDFVRAYTDSKGKKVKEGIESPVTQNDRHMQVVKDILLNNNGFFGRLSVKMYFEQFHIPLVVLANSKSILNDRYAPKDIKKRVIKADQLITTIESIYKGSKESPLSHKEMLKRANGILKIHQENAVDYVASFRERLLKQLEAERNVQNMICPFCGNELVKRNGKNGEFIGCIGFPRCRYTRNIKKNDEGEDKNG